MRRPEGILLVRVNCENILEGLFRSYGVRSFCWAGLNNWTVTELYHYVIMMLYLNKWLHLQKYKAGSCLLYICALYELWMAIKWQLELPTRSNSYYRINIPLYREHWRLCSRYNSSFMISDSQKLCVSAKYWWRVLTNINSHAHTGLVLICNLWLKIQNSQCRLCLLALILLPWIILPLL